LNRLPAFKSDERKFLWEAGDLLKKKVILLDRDGVINRDSSNYIKCWEEFVFLPGSLEAIRSLTREGYVIIVITNQSVINRKWVKLEILEDMHQRLKSAVKNHGGKITDIFFCPHTPDQDCSCRKPRPGLIEQACRKYDIDLNHSIMVGDSAKDILCGKAAGCGRTILVRTGNGNDAEEALFAMRVSPDRIVADLLEAARWVLS
jgi:D-glycero-D-manno-heptose 1,7-bisphosphate phosphatase